MHHKNKGPIIRSHHGGYTASHPNCAVKHHWARSVLRWGTTRESRVSNVFFCETCRQTINMPAVILWIRFFHVGFGPFLTMLCSKTRTWRPTVHIPLVFLAPFFPLFTVFLALFLVFFQTKTVCIHVWRPCSVSKNGDWMGINDAAIDDHRAYSCGGCSVFLIVFSHFFFVFCFNPRLCGFFF